MSTLCFSFPCVARLWAFTINECQGSFERLCNSAPIDSLTGGGMWDQSINPSTLVTTIFPRIYCLGNFAPLTIPPTATLPISGCGPWGCPPIYRQTPISIYMDLASVDSHPAGGLADGTCESKNSEQPPPPLPFDVCPLLYLTHHLFSALLSSAQLSSALSL